MIWQRGHRTTHSLCPTGSNPSTVTNTSGRVCPPNLLSECVCRVTQDCLTDLVTHVGLCTSIFHFLPTMRDFPPSAPSGKEERLTESNLHLHLSVCQGWIRRPGYPQWSFRAVWKSTDQSVQKTWGQLTARHFLVLTRRGGSRIGEKRFLYLGTSKFNRDLRARCFLQGSWKWALVPNPPLDTACHLSVVLFSADPSLQSHHAHAICLQALSFA